MESEPRYKLMIVLRKFYRVYDTITTENVSEYIKTEYENKGRRGTRMLTMFFNEYVLRPRNLNTVSLSYEELMRQDRCKYLMSRLRKNCENNNIHRSLIHVITDMRSSEIENLLCKDVIEGCKKTPVEIYVRRGEKVYTWIIPDRYKSYFVEELLPYVSQIRDGPFVFGEIKKEIKSKSVL